MRARVRFVAVAAGAVIAEPAVGDESVEGAESACEVQIESTSSGGRGVVEHSVRRFDAAGVRAASHGTASDTRSVRAGLRALPAHRGHREHHHVDRRIRGHDQLVVGPLVCHGSAPQPNFAASGRARLELRAVCELRGARQPAHAPLATAAGRTGSCP
jgi:hypothetical protein